MAYCIKRVKHEEHLCQVLHKFSLVTRELLGSAVKLMLHHIFCLYFTGHCRETEKQGERPGDWHVQRIVSIGSQTSDQSVRRIPTWTVLSDHWTTTPPIVLILMMMINDFNDFNWNFHRHLLSQFFYCTLTLCSCVCLNAHIQESVCLWPGIGLSFLSHVRFTSVWQQRQEEEQTSVLYICLFCVEMTGLNMDSENY